MRKATGTLAASLALVLVAAIGAFAQRTQSVGDPAKTAATQSKGGVVEPVPAPAPATVKAKYEGGVVGYGKSEGTLNFDDPNRRLIFKDKLGREIFSMPYDVIMVAQADTKARRPGSIIASSVPYGLGLPALLIKTTHRYLTLFYRDPDTRAEGLTSFKMENKDILASVLYTVANKAGLTQRGDAFVRRRDGGPSPMEPSGATIAVPVAVPPKPDEDKPKSSTPPQ
jgi:hypothetical protein